MFLVNGFKAKLIQFNRNGKSLAYDDEDRQTIDVKVIPYNIDDADSFGVYSTPDATGYFMLYRTVDIKEGDEIVHNGKTYSVVKVTEKWIYNRPEYKVATVK